jgi:hypothetical protein
MYKIFSVYCVGGAVFLSFKRREQGEAKLFHRTERNSTCLAFLICKLLSDVCFFVAGLWICMVQVFKPGEMPFFAVCSPLCRSASPFCLRLLFHTDKDVVALSVKQLAVISEPAEHRFLFRGIQEGDSGEL